MTATEAKSIADSKMAIAKEANEIYKKVQNQILEYANLGSYKIRVCLDSDSYDAVRTAVEILRDEDGFECFLEYKSCRASIEVSWEHA